MSFTKCLHGCKTLGGQPKGFNLYRTYLSHMVSMHPREEVMNEDGTFNSDKKQQSNSKSSYSNDYMPEEGGTYYDNDYYDRQMADMQALFEKLKIKVKKLEMRVKELEGDDDEDEVEVVNKSATKSVKKA